MSLFKITAEEAQEITKNAIHEAAAYNQALEDSFNIIRGDAKRGQKSSLQKLYNERQSFAEQLKLDLQSNGFEVQLYKDHESYTILSVSWL